MLVYSLSSISNTLWVFSMNVTDTCWKAFYIWGCCSNCGQIISYGSKNESNVNLPYSTDSGSIIRDGENWKQSKKPYELIVSFYRLKKRRLERINLFLDTDHVQGGPWIGNLISQLIFREIRYYAHINVNRSWYLNLSLMQQHYISVCFVLMLLGILYSREVGGSNMETR